MQKLALVLFSSSILFFAAAFGSSGNAAVADEAEPAAVSSTVAELAVDVAEEAEPAAADVDQKCLAECMQDAFATCRDEADNFWECILLWRAECRRQCTR